MRHWAPSETLPALTHMATNKVKPEQRTRVKRRMAEGGLPPQEKAGNPGTPTRRRSTKIADLISEGKRLIEETEDGDGSHPEGLLPEDATPLDVMLMAMRRAYKLGGSLYAAQYAKEAAPYLHAKISALELKNPNDQQSSGGKGGGALRIEFVKAKG